MMINRNFLKLRQSYLFSSMSRKTGEYRAAHPEADIIDLGIGDVSRPLPFECIKAMRSAVDEMADADTFRGYPPERGYDFLTDKILEYDFAARGVTLDRDEIFVSDGAKSDTGSIGDIFSPECRVAVCDPVYPVYADANVLAGRGGERLENGSFSKFVYLDCTADRGFIPPLPKQEVDIIYLCSPNNPTGAAMNKNQLKLWVDWAREHGSVILFDAAYEAFITDGDIPHSIFELDGAKECAIEFRSFSKTAGFTGVRCAYTVIPRELTRDGVSLNALWARRQATRFNGVSYITQRAAEAVYSDEGRRQIKENISCYLGNAKAVADGLESVGIRCFGGRNSPYIWFEVPNGLTSWQMFDRLLSSAQVIGTPGSGFGRMGEGYFRLTAFAEPERTLEAVKRIKNGLG